MKTISQHKYVHEFVWAPTYLAVVIIVLGVVRDSTVATIVLFVSLIMCRMFLEVIYRILFGDARLTVRVAVLALGCQLSVLIGLSWFVLSR
jgi:hypothetical protein